MEKIILFLAIIKGVDPSLALSIAKVESSLNPAAIGRHGEVGLFQLKPYHLNRSDLVSNINKGLDYIIEVKAKCIHKIDNTFVSCYNLGVTGGSKIKYPRRLDYYKKVSRLVQKDRIRNSKGVFFYANKSILDEGKRIPTSNK